VRPNKAVHPAQKTALLRGAEAGWKTALLRGAKTE
jgi:hypothetical protein